MSSDRQSLLDMGFDAARVDWALKATSNRGLQPAMDHLIEHDGQPIPDPSSQAAPATNAGGANNHMDVDNEELEALKAVYGKGGEAVPGEDQPAEAKSVKCSQCGKIFKNTALANYHAEKSGHDQFEESTDEIKPLTEEEKKQRLAELREKMDEKRQKKAKEEAKEQKANDELRRKAGKDMGQVREDMKAKETIKAAQQARQDKLDDAKARAAIKAQIEIDKKARAEKAAREKAMREGRVEAATPPAMSSSTPAETKPATAGKDYKETRLQIRIASGGQPYTTTLSSDATLREVAEFLAGQTLSVDVESVNFAQHFPRTQFSRSDFSKTLRELGLTPSAVLIAS